MALGLEGAIAQDLATAGFGTYDAANAASTIRVGEEPPDPDAVVVVLNVAGGRMPSLISEVWLITVRVRDPSYEAANSRLRDIAVHLQEKGSGFFGSILVGRLSPAAPPAPLGRDDRRRYRVEQTFEILMKRSFQFPAPL